MFWIWEFSEFFPLVDYKKKAPMCAKCRNHGIETPVGDSVDAWRLNSYSGRNTVDNVDSLINEALSTGCDEET